jgi:hypothetical protein
MPARCCLKKLMPCFNASSRAAQLRALTPGFEAFLEGNPTAQAANTGLFKVLMKHQHARGANTIRFPTGAAPSASSRCAGGATPARCCLKKLMPCFNASSRAALTAGTCLLPRTAKPWLVPGYSMKVARPARGGGVKSTTGGGVIRGQQYVLGVWGAGKYGDNTWCAVPCARRDVHTTTGVVACCAWVQYELDRVARPADAQEWGRVESATYGGLLSGGSKFRGLGVAETTYGVHDPFRGWA